HPPTGMGWFCGSAGLKHPPTGMGWFCGLRNTPKCLVARASARGAIVFLGAAKVWPTDLIDRN
ncbi:hypothetical protein, partial [Aliiglaciecola lipolytica]|uniref:hypothetical protein n=1 Tax=Aliiglaciecola lipolytica TaxID=477689 RepID=UPI001C07F9C6